MHPILLKIGPVTIYSYGVMIALAVIICSWLLCKDAAAYHIAADTIYDLMFWVVIGGIIGARLFYVCLTWDYFSQNISEIIMLHRGGLAWQGGFLGGILSGVYFIRLKKLKLRETLDLVAPYIALGQSIGRIGCFFNGCCYGKPVSWGVYFSQYGDRLHPSQLYETSGLFLAFLILKNFRDLPHKPGMVFVLYLWLAAIERFIVEFFRADHETLWLGLSLFQYISLALIMAGLFLLKRFSK